MALPTRPGWSPLPFQALWSVPSASLRLCLRKEKGREKKEAERPRVLPPHPLRPPETEGDQASSSARQRRRSLRASASLWRPKAPPAHGVAAAGPGACGCAAQIGSKSP